MCLNSRLQHKCKLGCYSAPPSSGCTRPWTYSSSALELHPCLVSPASHPAHALSHPWEGRLRSSLMDLPFPTSPAPRRRCGRHEALGQHGAKLWRRHPEAKRGQATGRPAQSVLDGLEAWRGRCGRAQPVALTEPWHGSRELSDESRSPVVRFTTQPVN